MLEYSDVILNEAKKYQNVLERFRLEHTRKTLENLDIGELVMIGVTGTKGKTTTTHILGIFSDRQGRRLHFAGLWVHISMTNI